MMTSSGAVVWSAKYTSFLEATVDASSTIKNNLRAPGQYEDAETGLFYNYFRYYNPKIGKYLRKDPINFAGGDLNLYNYVQSNPIGWFDIFGLSAKIIIGNQRISQYNNSYTMTVELKKDGKTITKTYEVGRDVANGKTPYSGKGRLGEPKEVDPAEQYRMGPYILNLEPWYEDEAIHAGRKDHTNITWGCIRMDEADLLELIKLLEDEPIDKWGWYKDVYVDVLPYCPESSEKKK
jgi:RHS repeat-associated protein